MQVTGLHAEVLTPSVRRGDRLTGQRGHRRVERLEHGQRPHVDAADGQPDRVATQVVGECFDLGQFRHEFSLP